MAYYDDKIDALARLFGEEDIEVHEDHLRVGLTSYPVVQDVIVTLPEGLRPKGVIEAGSAEFATDIQETFGREWSLFNRVLPEQRKEFEQYFDLVDFPSLSESLVCDLGAGMGRWSAYVGEHCRQVALVDFSDAIFVARDNLRHLDNAIFVMGDITNLPFADDCCDLAMCIGVLHTLPMDALSIVRSFRRLSPQLLVYLMYALDGEPAAFRSLLKAVSTIRHRTSRMENEQTRKLLTWVIGLLVYYPLIFAGRIAKPFGKDQLVPLARANEGKTFEGIRQVVYDRFFTSLEQRFTKEEIRTLTDTFDDVEVSSGLPYWHFLCQR